MDGMIKEDLFTFQKKNINLEELYSLVSGSNIQLKNEYKTIKYDIFYEKVMVLIGKGLIAPYGKSTNSKNKPLSLKYHINIKKENPILNDEDRLFLYSLNKKLNYKFYMNHYDKFVEDKPYVKIINDFLNNCEKENILGINERSYELFKDEKFIKGGNNLPPYGEIILDRLGIKPIDIKCVENYKPLLCLITSGFYNKKSKVIVIVENLDTYWSFNKIIIENQRLYGKIVDMLIYGQGNAITGAFANYYWYGITEDDNILYYGDIDYQGLDIFKRFKEGYSNLKIVLYKEMYERLINIGISNGMQKTKSDNQTKVCDKELYKLMENIEEEEKIKIINALNEGFYVPQEALNYQILKEGKRALK